MFPTVCWACKPGCRRCHFRLNAPVQGLEDRPEQHRCTVLFLRSAILPVDPNHHLVVLVVHTLAVHIAEVIFTPHFAGAVRYPELFLLVCPLLGLLFSACCWLCSFLSSSCHAAVRVVVVHVLSCSCSELLFLPSGTALRMGTLIQWAEEALHRCEESCLHSMPACARHLLRPELGNCLLGMVVVSAVPCLVLLCASPGTLPNWSCCREGLHHKRRSAPCVGLCSARLPCNRAPWSSSRPEN